MATRRQIREPFYAELETAVSGVVPSGNIGQERPNSAEDLPAVVHNDNYREVPMNTNTGPVDTEEDADGTQAEIFSELMEAQFALTVISDDEQKKEDAYEALRSHFGDFKYPTRDVSEIHPDANRIEVTDASSTDSEDRDPPARGDQLRVNLEFERFYRRDVTPAEEVQQNVDADNDGNTDITYTTTTTTL